MCGIVGVINSGEVVQDLLGGLKQLEYRGYDSAGIAAIHSGQILSRKAEGNLSNLQTLLDDDPLDGCVGIAHTRWATHGAPTMTNAHPHMSGKVSVVHNGIIENYQEIRKSLSAAGHRFTSDTDSEVIPHLITHYIDIGMNEIDATSMALSQLEGSYALAILFDGKKDFMIAARRGSPLAIGYGDGAMYVASDSMALSPMTSRLSYLEDGDLAVIEKDRVTIYDEDEKEVTRKIHKSNLSAAIVTKNGCQHFMQKEIYEQPEVIARTIEANKARKPDDVIDFSSTKRLTIVACGTSSYSGHVAKYWFERYAGLSVDLDIASEFRYREAPMSKGGAALFISQSGETADTLAALRYAKSCDQKIITLVNSEESSMAREADYLVRTLAGPEIGVASTKAFTAQLCSLALMVIDAGKQRGTLTTEDEKRLLFILDDVPEFIAGILEDQQIYKDIAEKIYKSNSALFIGRGTCFPIALEGALKLKEISYIHAEGLGAGELKHGPIALIDEGMPVIALAPNNGLFDKTISNIQEVSARGGQIILVSDQHSLDTTDISCLAQIPVPQSDPFITPILYSVPMQLLAYYTALRKGTNIDQPRNLAKSVTVE